MPIVQIFTLSNYMMTNWGLWHHLIIVWKSYMLGTLLLCLAWHDLDGLLDRSIQEMNKQMHKAQLHCIRWLSPNQFMEAYIEESVGSDEEVGACATDETKGVIPWLHVLPEMNIAMIEDICCTIQIMEALRRQHHAHISASIKERHCSQKEVLSCHLQRLNMYRKLAADILNEVSKYCVTEQSTCRFALHVVLLWNKPLDAVCVFVWHWLPFYGSQLGRTQKSVTCY